MRSVRLRVTYTQNILMKSIIPILFIALVLTGCQTFKPKPIVVEPGFRDFALLNYYPKFKESDKGNQVLIRLELNGTGLLKCTQGRSSRVSSSWWNPKDDNWENYFVDQVFVNPDDLKSSLQALVDLGILDRKKQGDQRTDKLDAYLVLQTRIGKKEGFMLTDSDEAIQLYKKLYARLRR